MDYNIIINCLISASSDDLARNKPAIQKSDWSYSYVAGKAVDGRYGTYSCTTTKENYPYWSVDLGMSIYVHHLYITNVENRNRESFLLQIEAQKHRNFIDTVKFTNFGELCCISIHFPLTFSPEASIAYKFGVVLVAVWGQTGSNPSFRNNGSSASCCICASQASLSKFSIIFIVLRNSHYHFNRISIISVVLNFGPKITVMFSSICRQSVWHWHLV